MRPITLLTCPAWPLPALLPCCQAVPAAGAAAPAARVEVPEGQQHQHTIMRLSKGLQMKQGECKVHASRYRSSVLELCHVLMYNPIVTSLELLYSM